MLKFFLFILNFVCSSNVIDTNTSFSEKEELLNDFCQGSSNIISSKVVYDGNNSHINFRNNCFHRIPQSKPLNGGALHIMNASFIYIDSCTFSRNIYGVNGGAIYFMSSIYIIDHCIFLNNRALNSGGAIFSTDLGLFPKLNSTNEIKNTYFAKNMAKSKGGGIYFNNRSPIVLDNITFESNEAQNGASIYFFLNDRHENIPLTINTRISKFFVNLNISQVNIRSNIEVKNYKLINFTSCQFRFFPNTNINTRQFRHLSASETFAYFKGKNLVDSSNYTFSISNNLFTNVIFDYDFDKVQVISRSSGLLSSSSTKETIISNRQQYIEIQRIVRIIKTRFSQITSDENGGAVYLAFCPKVTIKSVNFILTKTTMKGGSIFANQSQVEIFDSNFSRSTSMQEGGAIFIDVQYDYLSYFNIMNCIFEKNEANLNGGAICCKNSLNFLVAKCNFISNYAGLNGLSIYSYGNNDFHFLLSSSNFYSCDFLNSNYLRTELKKSEIELNSFQVIFVEDCFFTSNVNSSVDEGKIYLKGKETILWVVNDCVCLNTSEKSSIQMHIFNPFNLIHFNCTNHTTSQKKQSFQEPSNSTTDDDVDDDDKRRFISIVELPRKNVFMKEIERDSIVICNETVNDDYELKKFNSIDRVLPLTSQKINLTLFPDQNEQNSYEPLFLSPVLNDSKIFIYNENGSIEQQIGFFYQNISSEIVVNQNNSLISVKGTGNVTLSSSNNDLDYLNMNNITVSLSTPLNLSFSDQFKEVSINNIHFYVRGSLEFESNETLVSAKNVTIHQEANVKVNSLKLREKMIFEVNSKLEVTEEIKFDENSVIVFEFNETIKIKNFFHHKNDSNETDNMSIGILTIPSFSRETSGIPKKIIIRGGNVITRISSNPLNDYYSPTNLMKYESKLPKSQKHESNLFKVKSILYNSIPHVKYSSSPLIKQSNNDNNNNNDGDDENADEIDDDLGLKIEVDSKKSNYSLNELPLLCSDDFDFDFCTSLVSPNDNLNRNQKFVVFENETAECECFINELNQTCIMIIENSNKNNELRFVRLSVNGLVGVIFGSIAVIAALCAVIFVANGNNCLKFSKFKF